MRDRWEASGDSCDPRHQEHPDWETSVGGRQVGDKCKLTRLKAAKVGGKCGRQVRETSVNSNGPRHPEKETSAGDKHGK